MKRVESAKQKAGGKIQGVTWVFSIFLSLCGIVFSVCAEAKVYIDISSPAFVKLPIAIQDFKGSSGKEISDIIKEDLEFTGIFHCIDKDAFLEAPSQPFQPKNWTPLGVEAVVKGAIRATNDLVVTVSLYDVTDGKEILKKEYKANKELVRPIAHAIANDIYAAITGEPGIFRTRIIFVEQNKGETFLSLMDWDGHRMNRLALKANFMLSPRWSKDGSMLIYSAERHRQWGVYLLDFTKMRDSKLFSARGTSIAGDFFPEKNECIISSSKDGSPDLYVLDLKNKNPKRLTVNQGIEVSPTVSPDARSIVFVSDRGGSPQIYVMKRDGSNVKRLTFEGSYNTSPSWSPKGNKIVFSGRRGKNQIFTMNPDGTGLSQLTSQGNNEEPSFSPDGRYITFTSDRDGVKGIYIMRANVEIQKRVTSRNIRAYSSRWSPN
jgi:TolB protein